MRNVPRETKYGICACCKRRLPAPKGLDATRKALREDLRKAEHSIACLESALSWPNESESFREAVHMELQRMNRALNDHALLWKIFRRSSKVPCYAVAERIEVAA